MALTKRAAHHVSPHYNEQGGCLCECNHCVGWIPHGDGTFRAKCICRRCSEDCRAVGRLGDWASVQREKGNHVPEPPRRTVQIEVREEDTELPSGVGSLLFASVFDNSETVTTLRAHAKRRPNSAQPTILRIHVKVID